MIAVSLKEGVSQNEFDEFKKKAEALHLRVVGDGHLTRLYFGVTIFECLVDEENALKALQMLTYVSGVKKLSWEDFRKLPVRMQHSREEWLRMDYQ